MGHSDPTVSDFEEYDACQSRGPVGSYKYSERGVRDDRKGWQMVERLRSPLAWALVVVVAASLLVAFPAPSHGARARFTGTCGAGCVWQPRVRRIRRGDRIVWRADNTAPHTVKSVPRRGRRWRKFTRLAPGERTSRVFRRAGTYYFRCTLHPGMNGRIRVRR